MVVLGASPNPDRYAYLALEKLIEHGYEAVPVNPGHTEILGRRCFASMSDVPAPIDTITLYLGAARSEPLAGEILAAKPRRIIFNPGAENSALAAAAKAQGVECLNACTLVMLSAGTF